MRTQLLQHNKIAYKKVIDEFEKSDRTCVVHPTGTGKSFLIAAVSEKYKKVLVLGPNNFVLEQVQQVLSWRREGIEYMTYQMLCFVDGLITGYDLICLDEFHRAGAPEWGEAIAELLRNNPAAKVFGTSATPIRDNDNDRNMADELFEGHVASVISIAEAWNRSILPVPTYVTGLFDFASVSLQARETISGSKYLAEKEKRQRLTRLNNLCLEWERSDGMSSILRKYIQKDARRVIVFCAHISQLNSMRHTVEKWFKTAGFNIAKTLCVHADMTDCSIRNAMDEFESDDFGGIKLMLSVNMLNEGVHIPRVNAVLMLRTTSSRIIYMQQLGRCLTAANTEKPVVLDMVDNMNYTNAIHSIREEFNRLEIERSGQSGEQPPREFIVHDHCKSYKEMVNGLTYGATNNWETDAEAVRSVAVFVNANKRLPTYDGGETERRLYYKMLERRTVMEQDNTIGPMLKLLRKHGEDGVLKSIQLVRDFIKEKGRLPRLHEKPYHGKWIGLKTYHKDNPEIIAIQRDYCARHMTDFEATDYAKRIIQFIEENHRQPNANHGEEEKVLSQKASVLKKNYPTRPYVSEMVVLLDKYGQRSDQEVLEEVISFEKEHGRMPTCASERKLYIKMNHRRERLRKMSPEFDALCRKYYITEDTPKERFESLKKYCEEYGHLPSRRLAPDEYRCIWYLKQHSTPEFEQLMKTYKPYRRISDEDFKNRINTIREFAEKNGRLPSTTRADERQVSLWWERLKRHHNDKPEVAELLEKYPRLLDKTTQLYAEKKRREKEERAARKLPSYTRRQSKLRNYGKTKFGYIVIEEDNLIIEKRYNLYYDEQTHRVKSFEKSCKDAGIVVLPTNI